MVAKGNKNLLLITLLLAGLVLFFFLSSNTKVETEEQRVRNLFEAVDNLPENYSLSKSGVEWFLASVGTVSEGFVKSSIVSTTVTGEVVEAVREEGQIDIISKHYYVGEPGTYEYEGKIVLRNEEGNTRTFHFSPRRMEEMEVLRLVNGREIPASFEDIEPGDSVEVEETVDVSKPNVNDENLISITTRILE